MLSSHSIFFSFCLLIFCTLMFLCLPGEDPFGATVTLTQLLSSSREIVRKLVNPGMIKTFRDLLRRCGPETRLINVFSAICFVEGRPERINQESCLRLLWIDPKDRYGFGVTFHESREAKVNYYAACISYDMNAQFLLLHVRVYVY
jgi:hypothetical protein